MFQFKTILIPPGGETDRKNRRRRHVPPAGPGSGPGPGPAGLTSPPGWQTLLPPSAELAGFYGE